MTSPLEYVENRASAAQLEEHLERCDPFFVPPLSSRVGIRDYAGKLADRATRFEAWADGVLVGFVAAYFSTEPRKADARLVHISNVSVLPQWSSQGIAQALLGHCVGRATHCQMSAITLDVAAANERARRLYEKSGFRAVKSGETLTMSLKLSREAPDEPGT